MKKICCPALTFFSPLRPFWLCNECPRLLSWIAVDYCYCILERLNPENMWAFVAGYASPESVIGVER